MSKAVLFDLDGTLVDTARGITKAVQYALKCYGIEENDLSKLTPFIGPPLTASFQKHYNFTEEDSKEAVIKYREYYRPIGVMECELYPDVAKCISKLRSKGYRIGVASSKPEVFCRKILDHFGVIDLFDDVVGATEDGRISTKEEVLNEVMRRWQGVDKKDMCLIGDTIYDIEGANKVGIASVGVSYGFGDVDMMKNAGALCICDGMMELIPVIDGVFADR